MVPLATRATEGVSPPSITLWLRMPAASGDGHNQQAGLQLPPTHRRRAMLALHQSRLWFQVVSRAGARRRSPAIVTAGINLDSLPSHGTLPG
jgi:hypothetical protein